MQGGASLQHTAEGGATIRSNTDMIAIAGEVKTSAGTIYEGFGVNPKGTDGHYAAIFGETLRLGMTYRDADPESAALYQYQHDYPLHALDGMMNLITPAGGRAYGVAFDSSSHLMKIACGSNVASTVTQTITHNMGFAGVAAVIVSGGDDVGLAGSQLIVADSVGANSFEAKKLGGSAGNWRCNWVAIGWIPVVPI